MNNPMRALVIAEHDNSELKTATLNTVTAACELSDQVDLLVAGYHSIVVAERAAQVRGVTSVLHADAIQYKQGIAEELTPLIVGLAEDYDYILAGSTTFGKNFMPRVAALLDVAQISDVIAIESADTFLCPIYAGNVIATVQSSDVKKVMTIRTIAFDAAEIGTNNATKNKALITALEAVAEIGITKFIDRKLTTSERPDLTMADVIVSGGRGVGSGENFQLIKKLADKLGAAIGASRAAVDAGYVPNDYQVGQTGKVVAPTLYIAIGISGAIQHIAGMKDSKVIVAINKDEDAPIMQMADYALVADWFEVVPELIEAL